MQTEIATLRSDVRQILGEVRETLSDIRTDPERRSAQAKRQAELFSWNRFYSSIVDRIIGDLATAPAVPSADATRLRSGGG